MNRMRRGEAIVMGVLVAAGLLGSPARAGAQAAGPATQVIPVISTVAGNGQVGFGGDGGPATSAKLSLPSGVAEDIVGNVYIADRLNFRVRKVTPAGVISTVAGNGLPGFAGDGGPATNARLNSPEGVAVDGSGNLYIGDTANNRVRKVSVIGAISTYAGDGGCALRGDGGPATSASLCRPSGVATDSQNDLFIADAGNNVIREVTLSGQIVTVAGNGHFGSSGDGGPAVNARLGLPTGVAVDALHDLIIADTSNNKIREVTPAGIITTLAGTGSPGFAGDGGPATAARLTHPTGVGVDPVGDVYIADTFNERIRIVTRNGVIVTYAGTGVPGFSGDGGPATSARLLIPTGDVASDGANLYFADTGNERVRKVQGGPPPNIPESPLNILLPLSAVAILGGGAAVTWRRRRRRTTATP